MHNCDTTINHLDMADPTEIITGGSGLPAAPGVGFCGAATPFGVAGIVSAMAAGTWIWTDAQIQYSCQILPLPAPPCTEGGCQIRGTQCLGGPSYCLPGAVTSWLSTSCLGGADWLPTGTMCFMDDVEIFIY